MTRGEVYAIPPNVEALLEYERMVAAFREEQDTEGWSYIRPVLREHPRSEDDE